MSTGEDRSDPRAERIAKNEALYRDVNERVREVAAMLSARGVVDAVELDEYFCECGRDDCMEKLRLSDAEYEEVRSSPIRFAVLRDHVAPELEIVVIDHERYVVVEKLVGEQGVARATDPRAAERPA